MLRGSAALAVCFSHIRNYIFVDYGEILNPHLFDKIFYALTGLGHSSVIVFFVMSGYLVGGHVLNKFKNNLFNIRKYAVDRLVRLWVVLLPALLLTALLDNLGRVLTNGVGYDGSWSHLVQSGPSISSTGDSLNFSIFVGNIFFLQTLIVPTFGSNTPLWSLCNEFWYYFLFPCIVGLFYYKKLLIKLILFLIITLILLCFPLEVVSGFLFWVMGAFMSVIKPPCNSRNNKPYIKISIIIFILSIAIQLYLKNYLGDLILSIGTGVIIFSLVNIRIGNNIVNAYSNISSNISYSMYLYHFPIISFIWIILMAPKQLQPNFIGYAIFILILFVVIFFVLILWYLFERNNKIINKLMYRILKLKNE